MTLCTEWRYSSGDIDYPQAYNALPQRIVGGAALACVAVACAWTLWVNIAGAPAQGDLADVPAPQDFAGAPAVQKVATGRADKLVSLLFKPERMAGELADKVRNVGFETRFAAAFPPGTFLARDPDADDDAAPASIVATAEPRIPAATDHAAPAPSRIAALAGPPIHKALSLLRGSVPPARVAAVETPPDRRTIFEKLFGSAPASKPSIFARLFGAAPSRLELAYASPSDGTSDDSGGLTAGRYDRQTAVYDISAHKVYLPDGTTLEAHSGLGSRLDDPGSADERDRGVTPPDVYTLEPRETVFHGVRALRLIPLDETKVFGRSGLLAHSYMLGPNGDSNGCVSFKDYDAFLQAYENHEITRLAVVSHVD